MERMFSWSASIEEEEGLETEELDSPSSPAFSPSALQYRLTQSYPASVGSAVERERQRVQQYITYSLTSTMVSNSDYDSEAWDVDDCLISDVMESAQPMCVFCGGLLLAGEVEELVSKVIADHSVELCCQDCAPHAL